MNEIVDLHCHLLPGLDDGPSDFSGSLDILRALVKQGVAVVNASPHFDTKYQPEPEEIDEAVSELNRLAASENLSVEVFASNEIRIYEDVVKDLIAGKVKTVASRTKFVLIELPHSSVPLFTQQVFMDLMDSEYRPILVHPERNEEIQKKPSIVREFVEMGVVTQITASSLTGRFGKPAKKLSFSFFNDGSAHFIASDAHNIDGRKPMFDEAIRLLSKKCGRDLVESTLHNAQLAIQQVAMQGVEKETPQKINGGGGLLALAELPGDVASVQNYTPRRANDTSQ